jgi:hypothetical protein
MFLSINKYILFVLKTVQIILMNLLVQSNILRKYMFLKFLLQHLRGDLYNDIFNSFYLVLLCNFHL